MSRAIAAMVFLVTASRGIAQPAAVGSVDGVVMNTATGAPLAKAWVRLGGVNSIFSLTVPTDAAGRFQFANVAPSRYSLWAHKEGFSAIGAKSFSGAPAAEFAVVSGQRVAERKLELTPFGVIAGRVTNEAGEPLQGIGVSIMRLDGENRNQPGELSSPVPTDDRGQYRRFPVEPGRYYVVARDALRQPIRISNAQNKIHEDAYIGTAYPGTTDPAQAGEVVVSAGKVTGGIDFHLRKTPTYHIRGHLFDAAHRPMARSTAVAADCAAAGRTTLLPASGRNAWVEDDGSFDIAGLLPGLTCLTVSGAYIRLPVKVEDRSLDGIILTPPPSFTAAGSITFDDGRKADLSGTEVTLMPVEEFQYARPAVTRAKSDGSFTVSNLVPGEFSILVAYSRTTYVKSIRFAGHEAVSRRIHVPAEGGTLDILLGTDTGQVSGHVQSETLSAASEAAILGYTVEEFEGSGIGAWVAVTAANGNFVAPTVPPGEYRVLALDRHFLEEVRNPEFRRQFRSGATPLTIHPHGHENVTVTLIPPAEIEEWRGRLR